jgi:DtxR family Mn-dependent transcriptional regulator
MPDPLLSLAVAVTLIAGAVALLWPDRGMIWRLRRALRASDRVLTEDTLKHLFDCDYQGRVGNLQSVCGALGISGDRAAELLLRLEARELLESVEGGLRLTPEGRSYALRIVRIHRLWERYLSDETGLEPTAWHQEAELREHQTSQAEAEAMAARMGFPRYDPHGDPIPTARGEIAPPQGRPLSELPPDRIAEIVHIEDEPEAIYAQLVAEGLHPGMKVRVLAAGPERIRFEADAEEHLLAPLLAANLSVVELPRDEEMGGPFERLSGLELGEKAMVVGVSSLLRPHERRRMLDLGILPGTEVAAEIRSPAGDPTGYRIRGAVIALRREQAEQIQIERPV